VSALTAAEPRLDIRGWPPGDWEQVDRSWLAEAEGLFCFKLPPGFLAWMPRLRWVQSLGAGVDHLLNHPELPPHIPITRTDGCFGYWMARYTLAHLLADAQRLAAAAAAQADRRWDTGLLPEDLSGARAIVLGFGHVGRQIGVALREIGLDVIGIVRTPRPDRRFQLKPVSALPQLLPEARILVLAVPSTAETCGLVGRDLLLHGNQRLMLVNVSRGAILDTAALLESLAAGRVGRAVLDVFPEEPLATTSPLWGHPRVTVTPHHSGPSVPRELIPDILPNLRRFADGAAVEAAVDRSRGY
jgi:glyoxylate/hydroxypyruvate reductase A